MSFIEVKTYGPYALAGLADCGSPDAKGSPGAIFLIDIRDAVIEAIEESGEVDERKQGEIADHAASVMTHEKWQQWVDLCGYREDVSEFGKPTKEGIEGAADLALYYIAHRLVAALVEEIGAAEETEEV
ncbi:hypothetical protein [Streptomyces pseudovenezuelae]|uniref:hypothetical protein n=1 Tax=Streptomyces pseudovenezuelae TaxID=67350 RepID=UPI002E31FDC9|nr:hypothetical protein [Streptomyces pseudovenezuelae]